VEKPEKKYPNDASGNLFEAIKRDFNLKTDMELGAFLGMWRDTICRIRYNKRQVLGSHKYKIADVTGYSVYKIDRLIAKEEE